jgi:hypothetical protein
MPQTNVLTLALALTFAPHYSDQNRTKLIDDLRDDPSFATYQPSGALEAPGMVYALHTEGLAYRPVECGKPSNIFDQGKLKIEYDPQRGGSCNSDARAHSNERFYLTAIDVKENALIFSLLTVDAHTILMGKKTVSESYAMDVKVALPKHLMETLTVAGVHQLADPIFSSAKRIDASPSAP